MALIKATAGRHGRQLAYVAGRAARARERRRGGGPGPLRGRLERACGAQGQAWTAPRSRGRSVSSRSGPAAKVDLVAITFPKFGDGRGYSKARLLRERFGYKGELRAVGEVLGDQLFYMHRCGFDAFELVDGKDVAAALRCLERLLGHLPSRDRRPPAVVSSREPRRLRPSTTSGFRAVAVREGWAMGLLLVRHSDAAQAVGQVDDSARWLTASGRSKARAVAELLKDKGISFTRVVTSPRVRAVQTAEIFAQVLGFQGAVISLPSLSYTVPRTWRPGIWPASTGTSRPSGTCRPWAMWPSSSRVGRRWLSHPAKRCGSKADGCFGLSTPRARCNSWKAAARPARRDRALARRRVHPANQTKRAELACAPKVGSRARGAAAHPCYPVAPNEFDGKTAPILARRSPRAESGRGGWQGRSYRDCAQRSPGGPPGPSNSSKFGCSTRRRWSARSLPTSFPRWSKRSLPDSSDGWSCSTSAILRSPASLSPARPSSFVRSSRTRRRALCPGPMPCLSIPQTICASTRSGR